MADLAAAPGVTPSTAGRMCDPLVRKGLIRRQRARLPAWHQPAVAQALQAFARAAGEIPASLWPDDPAEPLAEVPGMPGGRS